MAGGQKIRFSKGEFIAVRALSWNSRFIPLVRTLENGSNMVLRYLLGDWIFLRAKLSGIEIPELFGRKELKTHAQRREHANCLD